MSIDLAPPPVTIPPRMPEAGPRPGPAAAPDAPSAVAPRAAWTDRHPVLTGLARGASLGLLGLVLLLAAIVIIVPRAVGGIPLTVLSGSMEPALPVGSLVVVTPVEPEDVRIGDVITYLPYPDDPTAITHRVVAITHAADGSRVFTVQGDANSAPDDPVQDQQVRARVWYAVPWLGTVNDVVNGDARGALVVTAAVGFFLWALTLFRRAWRERRRGEGSAQDAEGDQEREAAESPEEGQEPGAVEVRGPGARRDGRAA